MTEILAPAGGKESAYAAILAGADAVYLGLTSFSARSSAQNFDRDELCSLLKYAHAVGVRVHVAMNTLVKQTELQSFLDTAVDVWNCGVDAIIIQDIFIGKYLKSLYPQMVLHLSTQAGVCNVYGAKLAKRYGFDRVILARETKLQDIKEIASVIETEVFVQGALCTCFSGQCYMSSFAGGNSGNRGKCKQPCRKKYAWNRKAFEEYAYALSLSDLSVGEDIHTLIQAGVTSFKIEGRMRRPEYVSAAVGYYRHIVDGCAKAEDLTALKRTYNRGNYTNGLPFGQQKGFVSSAVQGHIGEYVGMVKVQNGKFICETKETFEKGDCFKILRDGKELGGAVFLSTTRGGMILDSKIRLKNADKVFVTTDVSLNKKLLDAPLRLRDVHLNLNFTQGKLPQARFENLTIEGDEILQQAQNRSMSQEDVVKNFLKVDTYPFKPVFDEVKVEGAIFMPTSQLNAFRRKVYQAVYDAVTNLSRELLTCKHEVKLGKVEHNAQKAVITTNANASVACDIVVYKPKTYSDLSFTPSGNAKTYLYLPAYMTGEQLEKIKGELHRFDGIYVEGFYGMQLGYEWDVSVFAGNGYNLSNTLSVDTVEADYFAISKEINTAESKLLSRKNAFALTAGDIKVMDLIYCPFSKTCSQCDKKNYFTLTDEEGRNFPVRRYGDFGDCKFEVFNCSPLVAETTAFGTLLDATCVGDERSLVQNVDDTAKLKEQFKQNYTKGHSVLSVL